MFLSAIESLKYVWNRVNSYTPVFMIFFLAMVYLWTNEDKYVKRYLIYPIAIAVLILLNPVVTWLLIEKLGYNTRVHRFFWIVPVTFILSYICMSILERYKKACFLLAFILVLWVIQGRSFYEDQHYKTENIYKVENEVIEISQAMHEISGAESDTIYINEIHPNYTVRQFDPSLRLVSEPGQMDAIMSAANLKELYENEEEPFNYTIYAYFYGHYSVKEEVLYKAIQNTQIEYLILNYEETDLLDKGWVTLEQVTEHYYIYKVLI